METLKSSSGTTTTKWPASLIIALWLSANPSFVAGQALGDRLDKYLTDLHGDGQFSGSVSVTRSDEVLLSKGYGLADAEHKVANTPQTRFRIGSTERR